MGLEQYLYKIAGFFMLVFFLGYLWSGNALLGVFSAGSFYAFLCFALLTHHKVVSLFYFILLCPVIFILSFLFGYPDSLKDEDELRAWKWWENVKEVVWAVILIPIILLKFEGEGA